MKSNKMIKLFLRVAIATAFLSAVADRFGIWDSEMAVWGNWDAFLGYTAQINPWIPATWIPAIGIVATTAEIVFGACLLIGFQTELVARLSGWLLLFFALAMTFSAGIKSAFDYSVFIASAAAFALSLMHEKYLEVDQMHPGL